MDQYYSSEEKLLSDGIVFDENDLQYFFNRGVSLKTIVEKYLLSFQVQETLCKDYPQFANQIISTNELLAPSIVATEISKGNYQPLEKYFDADYFSDYLLSLLKELGNLNQFDFDRVFDIIVDRNSKGDEFSVLNDDDLVKKLISIGGSKALIFANNPSAELVSLTEFSYSDYTLYDGAYKNSSALLLKFLKEGKLDALKYAKSGAITEEVIQIINQNNISLETLKLYSNLDNSPFLIKYLAEKGDYSLIAKLPNLFTDLSEFNYACRVFSNNYVDLSSYNDSRSRLLNALLNNKYTWRISSVDMSLEVAKKILDMGLSVDDFFNCFYTSGNWDNLIQAFCMKGEFLPVFFVKSKQLAEQYSDEITYNFYLKAQEKMGKFIPSDIWLYKFIKEGHYDLIPNYSGELESDVLKRALLWGYFPEEKMLSSEYFTERIKNISFSKEELEYLKSKLNGNSRYVIFFPELLNSNDALLKYIEDVPLIFQMLDESRKADFLRFLLKTEPELCAKLGNIGSFLLMPLIKENLEVLKYFSDNQLDYYMITDILNFNPNAMDFIELYRLSNEEIGKYLLNGYKFSTNSPSRLLVYALNNGIEVPKKILFDLDLNNLLQLIDDLNYNTEFSALFEEVFRNFYQKNPVELTYEYYRVYYFGECAAKDFLIKLFESVGISYNHDLDIKEKDEFSLIYELSTLPRKQESLTKIDEILKKTEYLNKVHMAFEWLLTNFDPDEEILKKREFADKYFELDPNYLVQYIDYNDPKYQQIVSNLFKSDAKKYATLLSYFPFISSEGDFFKKILSNQPEAFFELPRKYFNSKTYDYVKELLRERYDSINIFLFAIEDLIHLPNFDVSNYEDCKFVFMNIINNVCKTGFADLINKNDEQLKKIFARASEIYEKKEADFKELVSLSQSTDVSLFPDMSLFPEDFQIVLKNAVNILNSTGKQNTLEKNPIFSYDLVKYVYPLFGIDIVRDLLKYNTPVAQEIIDEIKNGNQQLLLDYYNLICQYNVFEADDKRVHFAFVNFKEIKELIGDILASKESLFETDMTNLKKVIINKNQYKIKSLAELKHFDYVTRKYWQDIKGKDDIDDIKNALATMFGYEKVEFLENDFNGFQLDNYVNLEEVRTDIIEHYGPTKAQEIFAKCFYDKKDISIVTLMKQVTESENINELKELLECQISNTGEPVDYSDDVRRIITKIRMLYNYQFNAHLTKIEDIKSKRLGKDDPNNPYGVTIIEMNDERFNFLVHRLYLYDHTMGGFLGKLMADPSLWTKLEGSTTLSTSSISDKGFWFLGNDNPDGVVYLFNNTPENFLLFMNGRDLYTEHGGYKIEPTADLNAFTTIDGLNQCSCYKACPYNEVAGNREGMLPCALACVGAEPNEATIRAAKYFSQYLGVDIPIIKFDIKAYYDKKQKDANKAKNDFKIKPTKESMKGIFFDGIRIYSKKAYDSIKGKIAYCMDILKDKYYQKEISFEEYYQLLLQMESMVSLITVDLPDAKKEMRKISLLRESLNTLKQLSKEEVLNLEEAALGESGIMYKYHDENKDYLVKPAVDKKKLASQPFRAEIQAAASKLQMILSPETSVKVESLGGDLKLSRQELVSVSKENANALENWVDYGGPLDYHYSNALLKEYVVDFLLCNFDCFVGNFIIDSNNNVRGIDKEQSFRFMNNAESLKPDFSYVPNGDARIPIYKIMFERYEKGEIDLDLSVVSATIENVKLLSDEEYKNIFHDYAYKLSKNHGEDILNAILKRRDVAIGRMEEYIEKLQSMKKAEGVSLC